MHKSILARYSFCFFEHDQGNDAAVSWLWVEPLDHESNTTLTLTLLLHNKHYYYITSSVQQAINGQSYHSHNIDNTSNEHEKEFSFSTLYLLQYVHYITRQ